MAGANGGKTKYFLMLLTCELYFIADIVVYVNYFIVLGSIHFVVILVYKKIVRNFKVLEVLVSVNVPRIILVKLLLERVIVLASVDGFFLRRNLGGHKNILNIELVEIVLVTEANFENDVKVN